TIALVLKLLVDAIGAMLVWYFEHGVKGSPTPASSQRLEAGRLSGNGRRATGVDRARCRGVAGVADRAPRRPARRLARTRQERHRETDQSHLRPGARGGALPWLDRRPGASPRRSHLPSTLYAAPEP